MQTTVSLGIDIGGTNIAFGIIDKSGNCLANGSLPTTAYNTPQDFVQDLYKTVKKELDNLDVQLVGIGVGAPNGNYFNGTIENAANLSWKGTIPMVELLTKQFGVPAFITNDAKAAAIGENGVRRGKRDERLRRVTLGTGLGSGIVIKPGKLVYGHDGLAGEVGHTLVCGGDRYCNCGRRGCLETYASATGIKRTACELLALENTPSALRDIPYTEITAKKVYDAAQKGDPIALEAFRITGEQLGKALANLVAITAGSDIPSRRGCQRWANGFSKPHRNKWKPICYIYLNKKSKYFVRLFPRMPPFMEHPHLYGLN